MLRRTTPARLASKHSPEREQREVMFARKDDTNGTDPALPSHIERPESANKQISEPEDTIGAIANETRIATLVATPEFANVPEKADLFDSIILSGSVELNRDVNRIARKRKISAVSATESQKEELLAELLKEPRHALAVARIIEGRLERYDGLMKIVEQNLRRIAKGKRSEAIRDIEQLRDFVRRIAEEPTENRDALRRKIIEALGLEEELVFEHDQMLAVDALILIEDALKADFKRSTFLKADKDAGDTKQKIDAARQEYLEILHKQFEGTKEFLDASLQHSAQEMWNEYAQTHDLHKEKSNEQMLKDTGLTANGFVEAFQKSTLFALNITRRNNIDVERNMPLISRSNYLVRAEGAIADLERAKRELKPARTKQDDRNAREDETIWIQNGRHREEHNELMAYEIGGELDKLTEIFQKRAANRERGAVEALVYLRKLHEVFATFRHNKSPDEPSIDDRTEMRRMPKTMLREHLDRLHALERTPDLLARTAESEQNLSEGAKRNNEETRVALKERLDAVFSSLTEYLSHDVCGVLGVKNELSSRRQLFNCKLTAAAEHEDSEYGTDCFAHVQTEIGELEKAKKMLMRLYDDSKVNYQKAKEFVNGGGKTDWNGYYDDDRGTIFINTSLCTTESNVRDTIDHERGHQVIDILTRKTGVCPNLFTALHERLTAQANSQGQSLKDLMDRQSDAWHCKRKGQINEEDFLDELVVQYADWKKGRIRKPAQDELALFGLFEDQEPRPDETPEDGTMELTGKRRAQVHREDDEEPTNPDGTPVVMESNPRLELGQIEAAIKRFDAFFKVYPERKNDPGVAEFMEKLRGIHHDATTSFNTGEDKSHYEALIDQAKEMAGKLDDEIKRIDTLNMDLADAIPSQKRDWRKLLSNVQWLSIYDMMTMFKDASEDIQRMWKRRGEAARSAVGKGLFGIIPDGVPFLGQLSREFQGREQASEQEEVGVWEKRYEKIDSHRLLHVILPKATRKDEIKAIINLLTKKGRMDWNYVGLWNVLETISRYHLPHEACKRDIVLRDMYLQKLIADIWKDKDLFEHWKNDNDSNIQSGKSHQQATIDTLSATQGGLAGRLRYLLAKQNLQRQHKPLPEEEEINPHLYEGILHYAMKNGKMSLEDKIFYLIQGVAHELLNIDRMKALTGEQGQILNKFPFIDFFNGKTRADVMRMATQLGFDDKPDPLFKPDERTSDFIIDEIANDSNAMARSQKALKIVQDIDHEDFPGLITMMDYQGISQIVGMYSGATPKISAEGLQNIFVGYNSLLQYYAIRAKLHKEKGFPFTKADLKKLAVSLAAYAHFDNLATGAATKGVDRPQLTFTQIEETVPVSGSHEHKTEAYRKAANSFVFDLVNRTEIQNAGGVDLNDYLGVERNEEAKQRLMREEKTEKIFNATGLFVKQLEKEILAHEDEVINMLAAMADKEAGKGGFIPENKEYTYDKVSKVLLSRGHYGGSH